MPAEISIPHPKQLEETIARMKQDGPDKLHILADFDKTLTQANVAGQKSPSVIAQLRNNRALTPDYADRADALYNRFHPFERRLDIPLAERATKMAEWWTAHHQLLIECGLTKQVMDEIVAKRTLKFRSGILDFMNKLHSTSVPLIIMSSGPGYMIAEYLKQENLLYDNVRVVANWYKFDANGKMIGTEEPLIHALNKYEITLEHLLFFEQIRPRKNVILLGDNIDDVGMVTGFDYDNLIKIGFLNDLGEEFLLAFKQNFDLIIPGDGGMEAINEISVEIIGI